MEPTMHGPPRPGRFARLPRRALDGVMGAGLAAWLLVAATPAQAIEVTPVSEREARHLSSVLPGAAAPLAPAAVASQPVELELKQPANGAEGSDRALQLDTHPGALVLAALALLVWGMRRTWRR
jgi:hypothetical protein